jgi:hypothetical protein
MVETEEKDNYLVIPIRMEKCEMVIRKSKKLTNLEIFFLKFIHTDNSLVNLLSAFNIGAHIMNYLLAQMFYTELIYLDLNKGIVTLNDEINECIENDKLEEYINKDANVSKFPVTLVQEKIGGEIFIEDIVKDFLRNPPKDTTNYINLRASTSMSIQDLKNYSLKKYTKCVRPKIHSIFEEVEKINFLFPIHRDSMYIHLSKEENKFFDLDFDIFPLSVQKSWQNAYNSQFRADEVADLSEMIKSPRIISNNKLIDELTRRLDSFQSLIENSIAKQKGLNLLYTLEDELENIHNKIEDLTDRIESSNYIDFYFENSEVINKILKNAKLAKDYIIICSDSLDFKNLRFLQNIIKESGKNDVLVLLVWGFIEDIPNTERLRKYHNFKQELFKGLDRMDERRVILTLPSTRIDSNFILFDFNKIFYNNTSYFGNDYYKENKIIPTFYVEGGAIPVEFLQFILDYLPDSLELKSKLNKYLKVSDSNFFKDLLPERKNLILRIRKSIDMFEYYLSNNLLEDAIKLINILKEYVKSVKKYNTLSLIYDFEHEDILIDVMDENKKPFHIITDDLNEKRMGSVFSSFLANIPSFSILLITQNLDEISTSWSLGKIKLDSIKSSSDILNYFELEKDINLNLIISEKSILISSNYRILAPIKKRHFKYNSKKIGLVINSVYLYKKTLKFIKNLQNS